MKAKMADCQKKQKKTQWKTRLLTLTLILMTALFFACTPQAQPGNVSEPSPTPETPVLTPEPVETSGQGTTGPAPSGSGSDEIPIEEIDGVAGPDDVLPPTREYEEYKALNSDVIGWITVPNTKIDYPVVRAADNEYYLTHNVEKQKSKHGAIFMDYRNADREQTYHIILYGHNMKNGTMFHDLNNYKQRSFFEENRVITFNWGGDETKWEVYLAFVWHGGPVYWHTRFNISTPAENFAQYMNDVVSYMKSEKYTIYDDTVTIKPSDQVLTLSTCTYEYDQSRYVVSARRIK